MSTMHPADIKVGDTVRFTSLSPHDNVLWMGKVVAVCDYYTAVHFEDIDSYYQDVQRALANINESMAAKESLTYILLKVMKDDTAVVHPFALDWINAGTLELIYETTYTDIRIYDISSNKTTDIMNFIKSAGYVAEILHAQVNE